MSNEKSDFKLDARHTAIVVIDLQRGIVSMTGSTAESHANSVERIFPRLGRVHSTEQIIAALS